MFNLNLKKLSRTLLPVFLRKTSLVVWLEVYMYSLHSLYVRFASKRNSFNYRLYHTSQVWSIEKVLNDRFDPSDRLITVEDGERIAKVYINKRVSNKPKYLGTVYLPSRKRSIYGYDFIVNVPSNNEIFSNRSQLESFQRVLNYYKLVSKKYRIVAI